MTVIPSKVAKQLKLMIDGKRTVRYANGRKSVKRIALGLRLELLGRDGLYRALVESKRKNVLIGENVLEDLDFKIDPKNEKLILRRDGWKEPLYPVEWVKMTNTY